MSKMKLRMLTALGIILVVFPPLYFGHWILRLFVLLLTGLISYEIASLHDKQGVLFRFIALEVAICGMVIFSRNAYTAWIALWLGLLFLYAMVMGKSVDVVTYDFTLSIMVGIAVKCFYSLYHNGVAMGFLQVVYICIACYGSDSGAYIFGSLFGKHKLIPSISPNKTIEGAIGGYLTGMMASLLFGIFSPLHLELPVLWMASLLLPFAGQVGDLAFSMIKRKFHKKDFSQLLPGHGGVLDRIDSLIFCLIAFNAILILWGF